jgi:hypothetical protein
VTLLPLTVSAPFQSWLMPCPLGSVHCTVQPVVGADPLLVTVTEPWNPPGQLLVTVYAAPQPDPVPPVRLGVGEAVVGDGEGEAVGEAVGDAVVRDGVGVGDAVGGVPPPGMV